MPLPIRPYTIGIAGGSGSGKSTLVDHLLQSRFAEQINYLPHDAYYASLDHLSVEARAQQNFDHPDQLENGLLATHIRALQMGESIQVPIYDFETHTRKPITQAMTARPIILVEGILVGAIPDIRQLFDLSIYVDTPAEERLARRILRDTEDRGRTFDSVIKQFRETVRPMHDQFVEPSKMQANIIIPWDWKSNNTPAIQVVLAIIADILSRHPHGVGAE